MTNACPIPTPDQRQVSAIVDAAQRDMMDKVHAAIAEAATYVREQILAAGLDVPPAHESYFQAVVHQRMYRTLCGATGDAFEGGDATKAIGLIRNQQQIANHYWGADIAVTPKA